MPSFPTYDAHLPKCLNPLNPKHYGLVLYWVFFRPTTLKCYLYQASPDIYRNNNERQRTIEILNFHAYRILKPLYLFLILLAIILLFYKGYFFAGLVVSLIITISVEVFLLSWNTCYSIGATWFLILTPLVLTPLVLVFKLEGIAVFYIGVALSVIPIKYFSHAVVNILILFLQTCILRFSSRFKDTHFTVWNEQGFSFFRDADQYLLKRLRLDPEKSLTLVSRMVGNSFYLSTVRNASWAYLNEIADPISLIYQWAVTDELERYSSAPTDDYQWNFKVSSREVLFSELTGIHINSLGRTYDGFNIFWPSTLQKFRCNLHLPLLEIVRVISKNIRLEGNSIYGHMLRDDFDISALKEAVASKKQFLLLREISDFYSELSVEDIQFDSQLDAYPHGLEIRQSFNNFSIYLTFKTPQDIATASTHLTWLHSTDTFLRPSVIDALQTLSTISQEVYRANIATSKTNQKTAILTANDALEQLKTTIANTIHPNYPEQKLLHRIIDQWQTIVTKAGGELVNDSLTQPVENPYVVGPPVTGNLFVGREDTLKRIEELWNKSGQRQSIVLYGHRRMGKTSILRNLPGRFSASTTIVNFNMQSYSGLTTTADLIQTLAIAIYDDLPDPIQPHIPNPEITDFSTPTRAFISYLKKIDQHRQDHRFIIAIDEFELIEQGIKEHRFDANLIDHWRGILIDFDWIVFAFAGLHTLQEMTENYWNPLFGSVTRVPVSFLSPTAAYNLITQPSEDFPIDYDQAAIDEIYRLTGGQPYLTQLICQNLVTRFNHQRFEEKRELEPRFTLENVIAIVQDPEFLRDGTAYFRAIWEQAQEIHAEAQLEILRMLAIDPQALPESEARKQLIEHDVIQLNAENQYEYRVELMREWVGKKEE